MITKDTPILEVLQSHPQARKIFALYGMSCIGCMGSARETIASGAKMHNIDVNALLRELNQPKEKE